MVPALSHNRLVLARRIIIDCDADPFIPGEFEPEVEKHYRGGSLQWDASRVQLWLAKDQKKGTYSEGAKLQMELSGEAVLNANVLDYLIANPHLIPEDWKTDEYGSPRYIFFWGTIYRSSGGGHYVRCLYWTRDRWCSDSNWLGSRWWMYNYSAALLTN